MYVRSATHADADAISKLVIDAIHTQICADFTPHGIALFTEVCAPGKVAERISTGYYYWVAEDDTGNISGVCALRGESHLYNLFTRPELHGAGIGRALWERAMSFAKAQGVQEITVNSSTFAIPVYERLGFVKVGPKYEMHGIRATPMLYRIAG